MEEGYGQQRRVRPDERVRQYQQGSRIPVTGQHDGYSSRPPVHMLAPPRPYQHRTRPAHGDPSRHEMPLPVRHADQSIMRQNPYHPSNQSHVANRSHNQYQQESLNPAFRSPGRHLSHISAMSSPPLPADSRPISQIESEYQPVSESNYGPPSPVITRHASLGRRGKPIVTSVKTPERTAAALRDSETLPPTDHATMEALTQAIRQGLGPGKHQSNSTTPKQIVGSTPMRMPFQGEPASPTSVYTDGTLTKHNSMPLSSYHGYNPQESKPSTIEEQEADDYEKSDSVHDLPTPGSMHPILKDSPGMSAKVPASQRPPKLNMEAVREAEARGSMTSLSDLIRRATKVASNLDRGKTASRLGHLDMFSNGEKLDRNKIRASTYSDVLASFPQPDGTGTPGKDRPNTMWPLGEKQFMASKSSLGGQLQADEKPKRRCCGMSPPLFVLVLVVIFLLIAAAVLVPVFLIVLPNQHKGVNSVDCKVSSPCQNGGSSVVLHDSCACVCVDGFTGSTCSAQKDPECVSATFIDGGNTYENATIGSSVLPLLQKEAFGISLNITTLLSTFANNNLSCASENSLVDFNTGRSQKTKRFIMLPGMMSPEPHVPVLNLPADESKEDKRFVMIDGFEPVVELPQLAPTPTLNRREETQSTNGIVFATSSNNAAPAVTAAGDTNTASGSVTLAATASSASATPSPSATVDIPDNQLSFAGAVVLYILQDNQINVAVSANQALTAHFQENSPSDTTVDVLGGKNGIQVNFDTFELIYRNGTTLGGTGGT